MANEVISIDQYPTVTWSRPVKVHSDGYEEYSFGLVRMRLNGQLLILSSDGLFTPAHVDPAPYSIVYFGQQDLGRPSACAYAEDSHPFTLEDADRINQVGELTRSFLTTFQQLITTREIIDDSEKLLRNLRYISMNNPGLVKQIGVFEDILKTQSNQDLPQISIEIAEKLKGLKVKEFGEAGYYRALWTPEWVIERYLHSAA